MKNRGKDKRETERQRKREREKIKNSLLLEDGGRGREPRNASGL